MNVNIRDINKVTKEFVLTSYDFFKRKYKRQNALGAIRSFKRFPEIMLQNVRALFVLSTGRCGTDFLNHVLKGFDSLDVHHEGDAKFAIASRYLYDHRHEISQRGGELAFLTGRHHALQDAYLFDQVYVETNNRLTFFAPFIQSLIPHARFIHLVRHPGDFVRSGMRRGYYTDQYVADYCKIRPTANDTIHKKWETCSRIEKISWLWYRTNMFIEEFKKKYPAKVLLIKSEELFEDPVNTVLVISDFGHLNIYRPFKINTKPRNMQKKGQFPRYDHWPEKDKTAMKNITGKLAAKYNYHL